LPNLRTFYVNGTHETIIKVCLDIAYFAENKKLLLKIM